MIEHSALRTSHSAITVFLADDHAVVRDGLRAILEAQGDISVVGDAADGRQAVRLVQQLRPDVAVVDIAMPELNGIEATRRIKAAAPQVQVVILTIHEAPEYQADAAAAGVTAYILKRQMYRELVPTFRGCCPHRPAQTDDLCPNRKG